MNKKLHIKVVASFLFFLLIFTSVFALEPKSLKCKSSILMDNDSGNILFATNPDEKIYPASTTKVLTAILALENLDLSESTVVTKTAIDIPYDSSNCALKQGEVMTIKDVLYGMMLNSGNDAANVLAEAVSGSINSFVNLMNEKAAEIGCKNTNFKNPHGYHDNMHYSSPWDMMKLLSYALENEEFAKIISTKSYTIEATNKTNSKRNYKNTNRLILTKEESSLSRYYEYCIGGKTGYTDEAGRCLVAYSKNGDKNLLVGIFNCTPNSSEDYRYSDAINLFEYGFNNFDKQKLINKKDYAFTYENSKNEMIYDYSINSDIYALQSKDSNNNLVISDYKITLDYDKLNTYDINTENYKNQEIGNIVISFKQNSYSYDKTYPLTLENISQIPWIHRSSTKQLFINIAISILIIIILFLLLKISVKISIKKRKSNRISASYTKGNVKYRSRRKRSVK